MKKGMSVQKLVILGVLVAMEVVLSRFVSISTWNMKIGFAFIPVAAAAILLGPVEAAVCGGLADFLGATLFPIGTYFPGFTAGGHPQPDCRRQLRIGLRNRQRRALQAARQP